MVFFGDEYKKIHNQKILIDCIMENPTFHPTINKILSLLLWMNNDIHCVNLSHYDLRCTNQSVIDIIQILHSNQNEIYVFDKKRFIHLTEFKCVNDVLILEFLKGGDIKEEDEFQSTTHKQIKGFSFHDVSNQCIPISIHIKSFENRCNQYKLTLKDILTPSFYGTNNNIVEPLQIIEKNGMCVNKDIFLKHFKDKEKLIIDDKVYTEYNIFTSTGRPSNRFGGVNYSALKKDDGCRQSFISRFGNDGMLVSMDYRAYHPHIIKNLINYTIDKEIDIYKYLGQYYFNGLKMTDDMIKESKSITFKNLYGGIEEKYKNIPFFNKVSQYIDHRWRFFIENGYVETPVYKRNITKKHIINENPSKLFNYILQAVETEFSIQNIDLINKFLSDKLSKVILYTYDSILIDASKDDGLSTLKEVKRIMMNNEFPVKCLCGFNYNDLTVIDI